MLQVFRVLYIALIGYLIFNMIKRGGCCGGHRHQQERPKKRDDIDKSEAFINADEKNNAIDI